jgi:hypothetical protein
MSSSVVAFPALGVVPALGGIVRRAGRGSSRVKKNKIRKEKASEAFSRNAIADCEHPAGMVDETTHFCYACNCSLR